VHPKPEPVVELEEHLLADGFGVDHHVVVELGGPGRESPLRRRRGDALTHEMQRELARNSVDGVTLWHAD
jgi:ParB-like chromosome segregation protein Spo0J